MKLFSKDWTDTGYLNGFFIALAFYRLNYVTFISVILSFILTIILMVREHNEGLTHKEEKMKAKLSKKELRRTIYPLLGVFVLIVLQIVILSQESVEPILIFTILSSIVLIAYSIAKLLELGGIF